MSVFDLSEIQAQYILDTPLRRLTRYDRLELERERETLQAEIAELTAILESPRPAARAGLRRAGRRRQAVRRPAPHRPAGEHRGGQDRRRPARGGRRPVPGAALLGRARWPAPRPRSRTGRTAPPAARPRGRGRPMTPSSGRCRPPPAAPSRVVTSLGRMIRVGVLEIPALPPSAHSPGLSGGAPDQRVRRAGVGRDAWSGSPPPMRRAPGWRWAPRAGVVKRVAPDYPGNATEFEVIALKDGDRVVGAVQLASEDQDLVFITSDAPAAAVRRAGGPPAGPRRGRHGGHPAVRAAPR